MSESRTIFECKWGKASSVEGTSQVCCEIMSDFPQSLRGESWMKLCGSVAKELARQQMEVSRLTNQIAAIREQLETIVCTEGIDAGVVLLSHDGPTHFDPAVNMQVYDHEYFSPLGDALIALHDLTTPAENVGKGTD